MRNKIINSPLLTGVLIAIILGGIFYWFQIRPAQARKECSTTIWEKLRKTESKDVDAWQDMYDLAYKKCLGEHGLEK